jgi:predicted MFS family arabinose efflux permease
VTLRTRLFRLVWGGDVPRELRPLLAVALAGSVGFSTVWTFIGIWAIEELGASSAQLGTGFLIGAAAATAAGYLGGHLSDYIGRRPLVLADYLVEAAVVLAFIAVGHHVYVGIALMALGGVVGSIASAANQALVADLVAPEEHETAYASVRVANNLGVTLGPPLGGLLLLGESWARLFVGVAVLLLVTFGVAYRLVPARGKYTPEGTPERGSFAVIRRDGPFLLFLVSGALAYLVYVAFETVLPISAVDTYGFAPSLWGFVVVINPASVTLFQLRLTRRVAHLPAAPRLAAAMLLMGFPFLLLPLNASVPVLLLVLALFVLGEMLWVPTSQAIVAGLAPADIRGAYMGAFSSTGAIGFALAPFFGLQVRAAAGDTAMWAMFAAFSLVAAATGVAACRVALGRRPAEPAPAAGPSS